MPRALACLVLLLAACADEQAASAPLTPLEIRRDFFGHTMEATAKDGTRTLYRFERADYAQRIGESSEYIRWHTDGTGLCLQEYGEALVCAPVYQLNVAHFRWGDLTFSDLTVRAPGAGLEHDRDRGFPMH